MKRNKISDNVSLDNSILKTHLLDSGRLTEDQLLQAEDYALTRKISIEETLLFLNLLDYNELGSSLGEIFGKPYQSLMREPPPDAAKATIPLKFAERWKVFPVAHDTEKNILTLAVGEPDDYAAISELQSILPAHVKLAFTVASKAEIDQAIDVYYKGKARTDTPDLELPKDFAILLTDEDGGEGLSPEEERYTKRKILLLEPDLARAGALKTILRGEGYRNVHWIMSSEEIPKVLRKESFDIFLVNGRSFQPGGAWLKKIPEKIILPHMSFYHLTPLLLGEEYPYHQMSEVLINMVALIVRKGLEPHQKRLKEIVTRVKYCKLLALRLGLNPAKVDGAVLAAWLSAKEFGKKLVGSIATPYHLEEILEPLHDEDNEERMESIILRMVKKYQAIRKNHPEVSTDINRVRGLLGRQFSFPEGEGILETFLHLIKDEEFLRKVDQPDNRILIVDPEQSEGSSMALRLSNDGYEVEISQDARQSIDTMSESKVDLIISEINLPGTDGMSLCRTVKENSITHDIPFFFLTSEEGDRLATMGLEAGADDFLKKPADLDLLSLKIQRILALRAPQKARRGVTGSLSEMNSMDFIQSLSEGQKGVKITIESMGQGGSIYMQKGEIIHASLGDMAGEDAFCRLMVWEEGEFEIVPCSNFPDRTIHQSTMSLLMEAARLADEAEGPIDEED